jgi:teichoic acid transport system permease protein
VDERGKISAPGSLTEGAVISADAPLLPDEPLAALAERYRLKLSGARPSLREYLAALWGRRYFIVGYATARNVSMYTDAKLGQLWQVLTPLLNACVYYLIFGILFQQSRGVEHYEAFLVAGVFVFAFTERSIVTGSTVMRVNLQLIRALYFPRASLPLAYVIVELQQMLVGMGVLFVIVLAYGEPLTWYWFLLVPAVILQTLFNTGAALLVARMGGSVADVSELIPFFLRITRYFCGVMYMVTTLPIQKLPEWVSWVLTLNPPAVFISLVRVAVMQSYRHNSPGNQPYNYTACTLFKGDDGGRHISRATHTWVSNIPLQANCHAIVTNSDLWLAAIGWGVGFFVVGLIFFWRAEHVYGRG